jgi:hypothetical protein
MALIALARPPSPEKANFMQFLTDSGASEMAFLT